MELNTTFYGTIVKPGRKIVFEPNKERSNKLHLSQAVLGSQAVKGERVVLKCRRADEGQDDIYLCSLRSGQLESCLLDLMFDEYVEFSIDGDTAVHLTGYTITYEDDESSYDSDMEDELEGAVRMLRDQPESEEDGSGDYSDDTYDSYDDSDMIELMTDEDSDDDESEDSEAEAAKKADNKKGGEPDYIIEEIVEDESAKAGSKGGSSKDKDKDKGKKEKAKGSNNSSKSPKKQPKRSASDALQNSAMDSTPPKKRDKGSSSSPASSAKKEKDHAKGTGSSSKGNKQGTNSNANASSSGGSNQQGQSVQRFPSGLEVINTAMGKAGGKLATNGKRIYVKYVGRLKKTGQVFDKSKKPFCFRLGVGEVIAGWDIGVKGMRVGDKRRITVPPSLGYGGKRTGPIPANSTLVFDVELVDVR